MAVTGSILGSYLGLAAIPQKYLEHLEARDVILELADDLYDDYQICEQNAYQNDVWKRKYMYNTYKPV